MKLLIVDDDGLIRDSLKLLFETQAGWETQTADSGSAAYEACKNNSPDVILMDIRMPDMDGVETTRKIKAEFPDIKIVMLTTFTDDGYISSSISAGAEGYLLKSTPADGIIERIRAVEKGAQVFDKGVKLPVGAGVGSLEQTPACPPDFNSFSALTERENEVLALIATGLSNGEIAAKLFLSAGTVRNTVSVILEKLQLRDRTQLAVHYWKNIK